MTPRDFVELVDSVSYKPGWKLEAYDGAAYGYAGMAKFITRHDEVDPMTGESLPVVNEQTIDPYELQRMDRARALDWLRVFFMGAEEHEMKEHFKVGGKQAFDPHPELRFLQRFNEATDRALLGAFYDERSKA